MADKLVWDGSQFVNRGGEKPAPEPKPKNGTARKPAARKVTRRPRAKKR